MNHQTEITVSRRCRGQNWKTGGLETEQMRFMTVVKEEMELVVWEDMMQGTEIDEDTWLAAGTVGEGVGGLLCVLVTVTMRNNKKSKDTCERAPLESHKAITLIWTIINKMIETTWKKCACALLPITTRGCFIWTAGVWKKCDHVAHSRRLTFNVSPPHLLLSEFSVGVIMSQYHTEQWRLRHTAAKPTDGFQTVEVCWAECQHSRCTQRFLCCCWVGDTN